MGSYTARNRTGNVGGPTARIPGQPGTKQYTKLTKVAEHYHGQGPTHDAIASGKLDIALVRQVEEKLGMPVFGPPTEEVDPADIIGAELQRSAGHVRDLENIIRQFEQSDLIEDDTVEITEEKTGGGQNGDYSMTRTEKRKQISLIYNLYERERKHLASVASAAVKAGLEIRRIRIAEAQLDRVQAAILLALSDLGVDTGDSSVRKAIGTRIRELQVGDAFTPEPVTITSEREPVHRTPPPPPAEF